MEALLRVCFFGLILLRLFGSQLKAKKMMADEGETSSAEATTSGRRPSSRDFDVFLNFRGPDSLSTVVDVIYDAFLRAGVRVFYDDESTRQGIIIPGLVEAITNSSIYIPIFSRDYASSTWCLRELAKIIECYEASKEKTILPIFYDVDVSKDHKLKWQVYTTALRKHKDVLGKDVVKPWEIALRKAAKISGRDTRKHGLTELTELIVEEVCCQLWTRSEPNKVPHGYVGINDPMKDVMRLLELDAPDVRFVTIHGVGGVGKTALAKFVFNSISSDFRQGVAFLSDIGEKSRTSGIVNLQKDLLSQLLQENSFDLSGDNQGVNIIKERLKDKKVLIVLDDLDSSDQLSKLAGQRSWFKMGSRIIISTRDIGITPEGDGFHRYKMQELKFDDALKLFSRRVFESDSPPEEYNQISREVVRTTGGFPLAINIIAPLFRYNRKYAGEGTLKEIKEEDDKAEATTSRGPSSMDFDVFLNFPELDGFSTFVSHLYHALRSAGVRVFNDGEVMEAITGSKIYIPVFSKNYASSRRCFLELEKIMECREASQEQGVKKMILPIFYDVDPKDVALKTDVYSPALQVHKSKFGKDVVNAWEILLKKAANIKGWVTRKHMESEIVNLIVEDVCRNLWIRSDPEKLPDDYVGLDKPVEDIMKLLDPEASDVRFVTILGMGGIGKTTLARFVYNRLSSHFEGAAFLSDVRSKSNPAGIVNLQNDLISQLLRLRSFDVDDADQGVNIIKRRLSYKRVLIVLDGLDSRDHLSKLAGNPSWFGLGSRVIITTRDVGIIPKDKDFFTYKMHKMRSEYALKLFSRKVFKSDLPPEEYDKISREVVDDCEGNPLALQVVGSALSGRDKVEWKAFLKRHTEKIDTSVQEILKISYNNLNYDQQRIFLDVACLFINEEIEDATYYWEAQELYPKVGIRSLIDRCLIRIVHENQLDTHELLRDLGMNIVFSESHILERRSRLWSPEEALSVVRSEKGTKEVLALKLGVLGADCHFTYKQFAGLTNLMFLELKGGNFKKEDFKKVFSKLRWLSWDKCPNQFEATNLCFENLIVLMLSENLVADDWGGWPEIKAAKNLKVLKCINCLRLTKSPNFSAFRQLERLVFKFCAMLRDIDPSVGLLEHLTYLEFTSLFKLERLPDSIGGLKSLSVLKLRHVNLSKLPDSIGELQNLEHLCLWCPPLKELPKSVGKLKSLVQLDISHTAITKLPESVSNLKSLKVFKCEDCPLKIVPDNMMGLIPSSEFDPSSNEGIEISKDK